MLPVNVAAAEKTSMVFEEGRSYDAPSKSYPNPAIEEFRQVLEDFDNGGDLEPVIESSDELRKRFEELVAAVPEMLATSKDYAASNPEDDLSPRIAYLIQRGSQLFEEALDSLVAYVNGDDLDIDSALEQLQLGNDYLVHSAMLTRGPES